MKKYRVAINVEIADTLYETGSIVELDDKTARLYNHALRVVEEKKVEEEEADGGNQ